MAALAGRRANLLAELPRNVTSRNLRLINSCLAAIERIPEPSFARGHSEVYNLDAFDANSGQLVSSHLRQNSNRKTTAVCELLRSGGRKCVTL